MIEFVIEAGKYLFKFYERNAEAQNLVLSIQRFIDVGAPEEARKCCYELIRLSHKHPDVYFLLATAQYELKEYDNCLKAIQKAIEVQSSHSYWELKGDALKALDRYQEAIDVYNHAIKLNPSSQTAKQKIDACQATRQLFFGGISNISPLSQFKSNIQLKSDKGIDYRELEKLLKAKEWRKADELTAKLMCQVANREKEGWLDKESIKSFPQQDLRTIDQLWMHYSNSKFGFSIQKKTWMECGGEIGKDDCAVVKKFAAKIGWYHPQNNDWRTYAEFMNDTRNAQTALPASLPEMRLKQGGVVVGWCTDFFK